MTPDEYDELWRRRQLRAMIEGLLFGLVATLLVIALSFLIASLG